MPVEELTQELQRKRAERLAKANSTTAAGDTTSSSSAPPSVAADDDQNRAQSSSGLSASFQSDAFLHASQSAVGSPPSPSPAEGTGNDGETAPSSSKLKRTKAQLWKEVKITCMLLPFSSPPPSNSRLTHAYIAITRSFTLLYILSLLTIFTRTQLNLLGRRNYLTSVISLATPPSNSTTIRLEDNDDDLTQTLGDDFETNRRYLAFSWWLLHRGWRELMDQVRVAVSEVFGPLNPREDITLSKLSELTLRVRKNVEGSTEQERRWV